jgi:predicted nucleic acid-binding protein
LLNGRITAEYARLKCPLRKAGMTIDDFDILIAATAIVKGLTVVTNNEKHFSRIEGLKIVNWT